VLLLLWVWLFLQEGAFAHGPNGKTFAGDLAMFVSASRVLAHGGNPFDPAMLFSHERSWIMAQGVHDIARRAVVRVGNPPLFFWVLQPLTGLPFARTAWIVFGATELLLLAGILVCLRAVGWTARLVPALYFLLMPQALLAGYEVNVAPLVALGLALALLSARRHPALCGAVLTACWLKPPVGLPFALLVILFVVVEKRRAVLGFCTTSVTLLVVTLLTTGAISMGHWLHGLAGYSADIAQSPSITSLSGLYVRWAPSGVRTMLEALTLLTAVALTVWAWRNRATGTLDSPVGPVWLWFVWFLAVPYAHFYDEIVLTAPLLVLLGRNGQGFRSRGSVVSIYLMFFSLMVLSWAPGGVQLLCLPVLIVACIAYLHQRRAIVVSHVMA
jgi:hypothetical protein